MISHQVEVFTQNRPGPDHLELTPVHSAHKITGQFRAHLSLISGGSSALESDQRRIRSRLSLIIGRFERTSSAQKLSCALESDQWHFWSGAI